MFIVRDSNYNLNAIMQGKSSQQLSHLSGYRQQGKIPFGQGGFYAGDEDLDEFEDQYDSEGYYDEEALPSDDSELLREVHAQQMAIKQQQEKAKMGTHYSGPGSQPIGSQMMFGGAQGAGQIGGGMGSMGMGGTQFGAGSMGGGGFTYGSASAAGMIFGAASAAGPIGGQSSAISSGFGAIGGAKAFNSNSSNLSGKNQIGVGSSGAYSFGSASQFGGIGGQSVFGAGKSAPAVSNDPYANIDIDLSKVKKAEKPSKPFEQRTEEEKAKDQDKSALNQKSNLKTKQEDLDGTKKKEVRFGKSTTYQLESEQLATDEAAYNNEGTVKGGSPRPSKKIIGEKDLSDGRDEEQKIREQMEQEEKQALEAMRKMEAWKKAQAQKEAEQDKNIFNKQKLDQARLRADESAGSSSMSTAQKNKGAEESYSSDPFEEVSASGSGSKDNNIWTRNKVQPVNKKAQVISESSEKYDDDFESMSKSKSESLLDSKKDIPPPKTFKGKITVPEQRSILSTYVKKENKGTMTDVGKYSYMTAADTEPTSMKEWSLKRNLEDAELLIQELKAKAADDKETIRGLEVKLKQKDVDYQQQRRDALGANESVKRLTEQIKDHVHRQNLYSIESEQLIKQIDMADAKTREKEDELLLARADYDRKLKLMEERILYKREVDADRKLVDLKHEHQVEIQTLKLKQDELNEQIEYLNEKCNRLMTENKSIRVNKDGKGDSKRLEEEVALLRDQLSKAGTGTSGPRTDDNTIIDGLNRENEKAEAKIRDLTDKLKKKDKELIEERKRVHELQLLQMKNKNIVFVETKEEEPDIQTANLMGTSNAISEKQLKELHELARGLRQENDDLKRDWALKETQLKTQIQKVRDEKVLAEKQLYDTEFAIGAKSTELAQVKDAIMKERKLTEQQIRDLEDKVQWFRENQRILSEQQHELSDKNKEIGQIQAKLKKAEEVMALNRELEKKCKIFEDTIKSKNPNSTAMLIMASKDAQPSSVDQEQSLRQLQFRVKQLEGELDEKDKDFEMRLRGLRQENEKMKQTYKDRATDPDLAAKYSELEKELQRTKDYYSKRQRELEGKSKIEKNIGAVNKSEKPKTTPKSKAEDSQEQEQKIDPKEKAKLVSQISDLTQQNATLSHEIHTLKRQLDDSNKSNSINIIHKPKEPAPVGTPKTSSRGAKSDAATAPKLNPFFIEEESSGPKSVQQCLRAIATGKVNLRQFQGQTLRTAKVQQAFQGLLSIEEVKALAKFLRDQSDDAKPENDDYIEMDELISAVMVGHKTAPESRDSQTEVAELRQKLKRILRERDDDCEFFNAKIRQLKRQLRDAQLEKGEMEEAVQKIESQKQRIEKFYRQKMGLDGPVDKATTNDLMTEMSVLQRRLEFLEEQADERSKQMINEHAPCRREIQRLNQELVEERDLRTNLINKKNKEIGYFKNELDGLLTDIASTSADSI